MVKGLWSLTRSRRDLMFFFHENLQGSYLFQTSQVVGHLVVGLPFSGARVVVFDTKQNTFEFFAHENLHDCDLFVTSQVVGHLVVGLPFSGARVVVFDTKQKRLDVFFSRELAR
eukprot:TRINITY_DN18434_c0_g1_i1.p1 TRINITY_DN18434_c0_g1~~TRINITY_DN18434_c0_g1_i1.p1  ORF type:complete len:122 (+),score=13.31 TRINITY_DN18434_c0_g1_i1:26-367(+)